MAGTARQRHSQELMAKLYPAFSRRATQVCILSSAMEKIAAGCDDPQRVARAALDAADPFGWKARQVAPMPLAEQVADARRVVDSWPDEKRRSVQLEGADYRKTPNAELSGARSVNAEGSDANARPLE